MNSFTIKSRLEKFSNVNAGPLGKSVRPDEELARGVTEAAIPGRSGKLTKHRHLVTVQ